jgi:Na+-translocating ferredoxin:NAD+ oxidoreductase subunit C
VPGPAATFDLGRLHGGLRLQARKTESTATQIQTPPLPDQLLLPIEQHVGEPARPLVRVGERVLKGQLLAAPQGPLGAPVHASSSGTVAAIEARPVSGRLGEPATCIVIECDGEDRAVATWGQPLPDSDMPRDALVQKILQGGIVGLGGAVYPTAQKLMQAAACELDYLVLNGAECEPYISCDDMLMRERADAIVSGAQILLQALGLERGYIVVESDKPEAIRQLASALTEAAEQRLVLKEIPTIYPSGGEDQLVQLVTDREVPSGGLPTDVGCIVQNVGTAAAIHDWLQNGEALISRITTITGDGIARPMNLRARIGTPIAELAAFAGGYTPRAKHLVVGGAMTGRSVSTDRVPVVKATNCILVLSGIAAAGPQLACIRCGDCAAVCPVRLQPQQLFWHARKDDERQLRELGLTDCIECGCCDLVCPSHLPLTHGFRVAKTRIRELEDEKARAERARRRFEAREARLRREQQAREAELARQKEQARKAGPDAIAEIMQRKQQDGD